ncbi:hypothetical protein D3C84_635870 [compost metagenome]
MKVTDFQGNPLALLGGSSVIDEADVDGEKDKDKAVYLVAAAPEYHAELLGLVQAALQ